MWACFAGDPVGDLFKIEGTLNQSILQPHAFPSGLCVVGPSFVFQHDTDPEYTSVLCYGNLTKKKSEGVRHQMTWPLQSPDLNPNEGFGMSSCVLFHSFNAFNIVLQCRK